MEDYVEILGITQGSGAPSILQYNTSSRPAMRAAAASSAIKHRYNYRDYIDTDDGDKDFFDSIPAENNEEKLSDA